MSRIRENVAKSTREKPPSWQDTPGSFIAGASMIDPVDHIASQMEGKWGAGRLRLLVSDSLREKFDRQRYLFNQAVWYGDLEAVRQQTSRMMNAWLSLDRDATQRGCTPLKSHHMEVTLDNGTVIAIVPTAADWDPKLAEGRQIVIYTLDELGRMLENYREVTKVKEAFPGTLVKRVSRSVDDPLQALPTSKPGLNDPLPDFATPYGAG